MWHLQFSGGFGSAALTAGLNEFRDLFQPKFFYDSMIRKGDSRRK